MVWSFHHRFTIDSPYICKSKWHIGVGVEAPEDGKRTDEAELGWPLPFTTSLELTSWGHVSKCEVTVSFVSNQWLYCYNIYIYIYIYVLWSYFLHYLTRSYHNQEKKFRCSHEDAFIDHTSTKIQKGTSYKLMIYFDISWRMILMIITSISYNLYYLNIYQL